MFMHIKCKPYLLAFELSTLHFGTFHTTGEIPICVNLLSGHSGRGTFYTKSAISLTCVKITKSYIVQKKALIIRF